MTQVVWLVSYDDVAVRELDASGRRVRRALPKLPWLEERLAAVGDFSHSDVVDARRSQVNEVKLLALMSLKYDCPCCYSMGILTPWSSEAECLLDYGSNPRDAYYLSFDKVWPCARDVKLSLC